MTLEKNEGLGKQHKRNTIKIPITIELDAAEVDDFIVDVILNVDMFMHAYIGYWACRMDTQGTGKDRRVLLREEDDTDCEADLYLKQAKELFQRNSLIPLPAGFHELNYEKGLKIIAELYLLGDSIDDYDATSIDLATQKVLFGEEKYC